MSSSNRRLWDDFGLSGEQPDRVGGLAVFHVWLALRLLAGRSHVKRSEVLYVTEQDFR